ncbi:MAG: hypothetical protein FJW66_05520 [Actinobacteria bacterium]|nr:hypothetical protein [Actinomycetota bacterium]
MRVFLIIFSFINAFLYFLVYAYYENFLSLLGNLDVTGGLLSFLKIFILVVVSFLIGLIVSLMIKIKIDKSFFDYRIALAVGLLPLIFLILSQGSITNFIIVRLFNSDRQISELVFYFFSRQVVWAMCLGFAIGASVRIAFKKKLKHETAYMLLRPKEFIEQPANSVKTNEPPTGNV